MSRMITEVYRAFEAANVPDDTAEAAARAVAEAGEGHVVSETLRAELVTLRSELQGRFSELRAHLERGVGALRVEIQALRAEMRSEMKTQLMALEERINRKLYMMFGALAILITIYEFIGR